MLNVFNWSFRKRYYLTHPWKWFSELFANIRAAYRRIRYGFCWCDAWDFCDWWPRVTAAAIRHLAKNASGWPDDGKFKTYEEWTDWLHSVADVLESTLEDNWDGQNEYERDWHRIVLGDINKNPNITMTTTYTEEDKETLRKLYWDREIELEEQRVKLQKDTLFQIIEQLPKIWD